MDYTHIVKNNHILKSLPGIIAVEKAAQISRFFGVSGSIEIRYILEQGGKRQNEIYYLNEENKIKGRVFPFIE